MDHLKHAAEKDLRIAMIDKLILATLADRTAGLEKSIAQWRGMGHGMGKDGGGAA
jgi:hypothetical protein